MIALWLNVEAERVRIHSIFYQKAIVEPCSACTLRLRYSPSGRACRVLFRHPRAQEMYVESGRRTMFGIKVVAVRIVLASHQRNCLA